MSIRERISERITTYIRSIDAEMRFATVEAHVAHKRGVEPDGYFSRGDVTYLVTKADAAQGELLVDNADVVNGIFRELDRDRDAYISEEEWARGKR